jgi:hypothetical protein
MKTGSSISLVEIACLAFVERQSWRLKYREAGVSTENERATTRNIGAISFSRRIGQ